MLENIKETMNLMKIYYERFIGSGSFHVLFLAGLLIIFLFGDFYKKNNNLKECNKENDTCISQKSLITFGIFSVLAIIMLSLPIIFKFFTKFTNENEYHRLIWILPINIVIAIGFTALIANVNSKAKKIIAVFIVCIILFISGKKIYPLGNNASLLKIPDGAYEIIYQISKYDNDYKKLAGPEEIVIYTRQYDGTISLSTARSFNYESLFYMPLKAEKEENQAKWAYDYCIQNNVNYLVIKNEDENLINNLSNFDSNLGIELVYTGGCYRIFHINENLLNFKLKNE